MEEYTYQPQMENKKTFSTYLQLGGGIFIIILLISSLALNFSLMSRASNTPTTGDVTASRNAPPSDTTYKQDTTVDNPTAAPTVIPQNQPTNKLATYENEFFTILYPESWVVEQSEFTGGKTTSIKPLGAINTNLIITVQSNLSHPTLSERQDLYLTLGYTKDVVSINNIPATRLRGSVQSESPYQEVRIYFDKDNYSYLVMYQYEEAQINQTSEQVFQKIIATLKIL